MRAGPARHIHDPRMRASPKELQHGLRHRPAAENDSLEHGPRLIEVGSGDGLAIVSRSRGVVDENVQLPEPVTYGIARGADTGRARDVELLCLDIQPLGSQAGGERFGRIRTAGRENDRNTGSGKLAADFEADALSAASAGHECDCRQVARHGAKLESALPTG